MNNSENKVIFMIGTEEYVYLVTMNEEMDKFYMCNGDWHGYYKRESSSWHCYPYAEIDVTHVYDKLREVSFDEWLDYSERTGTDKYIDKSRLKRTMENKKDETSSHVDFSVFNDDCPF